MSDFIYKKEWLAMAQQEIVIIPSPLLKTDISMIANYIIILLIILLISKLKSETWKV